MLCLFCTNQEGIKEHLTKNCQKKNDEALPQDRPLYFLLFPLGEQSHQICAAHSLHRQGAADETASEAQ